MDFANLAYPAISLPALAILFFTSLLLLVVRDWRWSILTLAVQYIGVFLLVALIWPLELAIIKIVAGWMAGSILGTTQTPELRQEERFRPSGRVFRFLASGMIWLLIFSLAPASLVWLPGVGLEKSIGGALLIGMGLLQLGLTSQPLRAILGLLTILSGFEILYASLESSILVAGLLASIHLGLALVGAYLLAVPLIEEEV